MGSTLQQAISLQQRIGICFDNEERRALTYSQG